MDEEKQYLSVGSAKDLIRFRARAVYRIFEIIPGALVWITFLGIAGASFFVPVWAVIFIIAFDLYWFLKTVYLTWHLRVSFRTMREHLKIDWMEKLDELDSAGLPFGIKNWRGELWHLVILPYYKEGYEILHDTFEGLLKTNYPKDRFFVVLSGEGRAGHVARELGERLQGQYQSRFGKFLFTMHEDRVGELAGKGANEAWAAKKAKEVIISSGIPFERVIVSDFDVDTVVSTQYFSRLSFAYLTSPKPLRTSFQPVPLFINNIWEASAIARIMAFSSTFWHLMNQMRPERLISFSSHAFPFKALDEMGFWQVNVVSEDSRIFWQGLLKFDGDWRVEPLLVPISMDANVAETFPRTIRNIYLQQRRWAYGVADFPYMLYGFLHNKRIPRRTKLYWIFNQSESWWSWPTNSLMIFVMGWLPIMLGDRLFGTTVLAYNVPRMSQWILDFAMLGIITSIYLTLKLLPQRPLSLGRHRHLFMVLQWVMVPVSLIFSSIPAIEAETRLMVGRYLGFWPTPKVRKGIQKEIFAPQ